MSRVLVIDDEFLVLKSIAMTLEAFGYSVMTASSTDEALSRLELGDEPDAVIADYRLRDGDNGVTAIRAIRASVGEVVPAMILTGDTAPDRISEIHGSGIRVLHKPVSVQDLLSTIERLLVEGKGRPAGPLQSSFEMRP
jgi:CheY-like chemotaxis protein